VSRWVWWLRRGVGLVVLLARPRLQYDQYILSDERVVSTRRITLISETRQEASLGRVQDVSYDVPNLMARAFRFGNVYVETAGKTGRLVFENVPRPWEVQEQLFRRLEAFREREERAQRTRTEGQVLDVLKRYHDRVTVEGAGEQQAPRGEDEDTKQIPSLG